MTGEELVKMWGEESNAANDCIIEILSDYIWFLRFVRQYAKSGDDKSLELSAQTRLDEWTPILEHAKKAKEKGANNGETVIS